MKTDTYIKTLLTLIALFLGVLAADKVYDAAVPEAQAGEAEGKWTCGVFQGGMGEAGPSGTRPSIFANKKGWRFMTMTPYESNYGIKILYYCGKR